MRKHWKLFAAFACLLTTAALLLLRIAACSDGPPSFRGRPLEDYVTIYYWADKEDPTSADTANAADALRNIGDSSFPWLLRWMRYEQRPWRSRADAIFDKVPLLNSVWPNRLEYRAGDAARAFHALGDRASNAVPALVQLLTNANEPDTAMRAAIALTEIGGPALSPLLQILSDTNVPNRDLAVYAVAYMTQIGRDADRALPFLLKCSDDSDFNVANNALLALGTLDLETNSAVRALTASLSNPDHDLRRQAVFFLSKYGSGARSAVPPLLLLLTHPDFAMREAVTNTLGQIAPEALTNGVPR